MHVSQSPVYRFDVSSDSGNSINYVTSSRHIQGRLSGKGPACLPPPCPRWPRPRQGPFASRGMFFGGLVGALLEMTLSHLLPPSTPDALRRAKAAHPTWRRLSQPWTASRPTRRMATSPTPSGCPMERSSSRPPGLVRRPAGKKLPAPPLCPYHGIGAARSDCSSPSHTAPGRSVGHVGPGDTSPRFAA